ncbi:hypothetical protein A4R26_21210 [Niastella populi]|uniref:Uncharacterized protein n=1 Tax=Niastella populi TaxID=550983 RepID=A0A1V9FLX3_9BACT|nr:hypothetical protein A4R26_21210 [Niastella populi]
MAYGLLFVVIDEVRSACLNGGCFNCRNLLKDNAAVLQLYQADIQRKLLKVQNNRKLQTTNHKLVFPYLCTSSKLVV